MPGYFSIGVWYAFVSGPRSQYACAERAPCSYFNDYTSLRASL